MNFKMHTSGGDLGIVQSKPKQEQKKKIELRKDVLESCNKLDIYKEWQTKEQMPPHQIFLFDNFIEDSLCDELIKIIEKYGNEDEYWQKNQNVNCKFLHLSHFNENPEIKNKYDNILFNVIGKFIRKLEDYGVSSSGDSGYCLRKIYGPTKFHKDGIKVHTIDDRYVPIRKVRNMSVIIALNDDYEGGEFVFLNQNYRVRLKKGQLIAFPPYWTHVHGVEPLHNESFRYTINTWLFEA